MGKKCDTCAVRSIPTLWYAPNTLICTEYTVLYMHQIHCDMHQIHCDMHQIHWYAHCEYTLHQIHWYAPNAPNTHCDMHQIHMHQIHCDMTCTKYTVTCTKYTVICTKYTVCINSLFAKLHCDMHRLWYMHSLSCSPTSTFGTDNGAMQNELNPIVLHLCTQWHCLELSLNIHWFPIVSYSGELPALSLLLIFQLTRSIRDSETSIDFVQGPPGSSRERVKVFRDP